MKSFKKRILSGVLAVATMASMVSAIGASATYTGNVSKGSYDGVRVICTPTTGVSGAYTFDSGKEYSDVDYEMANGVRYRIQKYYYKNYYDSSDKKTHSYVAKMSTTFDSNPTLEEADVSVTNFTKNANSNGTGFSCYLSAKCTWGKGEYNGYNPGATKYKIVPYILVNKGREANNKTIEFPAYYVYGNKGSRGFNMTLPVNISKNNRVLGITVEFTPIDSNGNEKSTFSRSALVNW